MYRIRDERIKTGTPYNISLMDKVMNILKKYEFKLPVISNQKYNSYLKILGAFCEIKKKLTSHAARHCRVSFFLKFRHLQTFAA